MDGGCCGPDLDRAKYWRHGLDESMDGKLDHDCEGILLVIVTEIKFSGKPFFQYRHVPIFIALRTIFISAM